MKRIALALLPLLFAFCPSPGGLRAALAGGPRSKPYRVADFEKLTDVAKVVAEGFVVERVEGDTRRDGHLLRAVAREDAPAFVLHFPRVPRDIRAYESLTLRARSLLEDAPALRIAFEDEAGRRLEGGVSGPGEVWEDVRVLLADMRGPKDFDPKHVQGLEIVGVGSGAFEFDDLGLAKGRGNWRMDGDGMLKVFGEKRVAKAKHVQTEHFDIYTDSNGAHRKFPKALEETYDFILHALAVPEMETRLPVYIFQSKDLYTDFCVRFAGWTPAAGKASAGHACSRYFATYYQAPKSPVVTHELTHAIFHRTVGTGGGSWFQEGVAVYVEELSQGKSAAKLFAPKVRSGGYAALENFVTIPRLIASSDARGGALTSGSLYAQAGALFEFLLRGPLFLEKGVEGKRHLSPMIKALANLPARGKVEGVEKVLGVLLTDVDEAWQVWGGRPPRS